VSAAAAARTFAGYRRADGRVGVRNHVLVLSPTGLTSAAARRIAASCSGTIAVTSGYGRGQVAADAEAAFRHARRPRDAPERRRRVVVSASDDISHATSTRRVRRASRPRACRCPACTKTR
jgi:hypothetical protein